MSLHSRVATLDSAGSAFIGMSPAYLLAHESIGPNGGAYSIIRRGASIASGGTQLTSLTRANEVYCGGEVLVYGQANDLVKIYFAFE